MMINYSFDRFLAVAACIALAACSKVDSPANASSEIVFMTNELGASVETKAITPGTTAEVTSLAGFDVLAVTGDMGSNEIVVFNSAFTGTGTYKGDKFWPATDQHYKFYAANVSMTPSASGPTVSASNTRDVVVAKLASPTYKSGNVLTFNHVFARVGYCKVVAPEGYTVSNLTVKVTPKVSGTYSLFTDAWSGVTAGSVTTIADALGSTSSVNLYTVPGSYTITATYDIEKGDWSQTGVSKTAEITLSGGKVNNITANLPGGTAEDITLSVTLNPWTDTDISISSWI